MHSYLYSPTLSLILPYPTRYNMRRNTSIYVHTYTYYTRTHTIFTLLYIHPSPYYPYSLPLLSLTLVGPVSAVRPTGPTPVTPYTAQGWGVC